MILNFRNLPVVIFLAIFMYDEALAINRTEVYADSTLAGVPGFLIRMGDPEVGMNSFFVFEEYGYVRFSHIRYEGEEEWLPYPPGAYLTPPHDVGIDYSWSYVPDEFHLKTATVEYFVQRTVPAGTFRSASCAIRWNSNPSHTSEYMSITDNVGIVRCVYLDDGLEARLRSYFVGGGSGYFPLAVGNFWEYDIYALSGISASPNPSYRLLQCSPNPFNPSTTIAFDLPRQTAVSLRVFDVSGRLVRVLLDGAIVAQGRNETTWNGRDDTGRRVASGTYFYRLEAGEYLETRRMALIK